jgi:dipeptidyl aminopeptidase/acylaminoacyl peptidase
MPINRPPERLVTATRLHPARGIVILGRFVRTGFHSEGWRPPRRAIESTRVALCADDDSWFARKLDVILKIDVRVPAEGGIELGVWLFLPKGDGIHPAITMAHGFAGTKEHGLERFAQAFAAAGFVVHEP